jgi:hypothetical protein
VRRDTVLGVVVHLPCPDLHFDCFAVLVVDRRMQTLVQVIFRPRDIVVELARDRLPQVMDDAQHLIALGDRIDDHADGAHVENLVEWQILALHLVIDAGDVLGAAADCRVVEAAAAQFVLQRRHDVLHVLFAACTPLVDLGRDTPVRLRVEIAQAQVFQLPLDLPDAKPVRQRRENLGRLSRDQLLLLWLHIAERPHIMQPVGQLYEHDADIVAHRHEHLADVLDFLVDDAGALSAGFLVQIDRDRLQFGDPVDQSCDCRAELFGQFVERDCRVFENVVHERGGDSLAVEP